MVRDFCTDITEAPMAIALTTTQVDVPDSVGSPLSGTTFARRAVALIGRHRALALVVAELVALSAAAALVGSHVPGLVSSIGRYLDELRHPSPAALGLALGAEAVSLLAVTMIPRLLVGAHGVRLRRRDAVAVGLTANGLAVVLPGGSVPSSVWLAHQLTRRGARPALAAWTVLASGFASTVTLILIFLVGAGVASVIPPVLAVVLALVVLAGSLGFLSLVRRVDVLVAWSARRQGDGPVDRAVDRFVVLAAESAHWRAGWRTGGAVLAAAAVNWLADAACLVGVFALVDSSVPWRSVLVAYAAGQLLGAVVPLPGGLGAVEGGLVGTLVALGSPAGPVILVVAIYRLLGYWLPAVLALPAYGWTRRGAGMAPAPVAGTAPDVTSVDLSAPDVTSVDLSAVDVSAVDLSAVDLSAVDVSAVDVTSGANRGAPVPVPVPAVPARLPEEGFGIPPLKRAGSDRRAALAFAQAMSRPAIDLEMIGAGEGEPVMCRSR